MMRAEFALSRARRHGDLTSTGWLYASLIIGVRFPRQALLLHALHRFDRD